MSATLGTGAFFGRSAPVLEVGEVTLAETRYAPGFVVPLHDHAHPILCLDLAGQFTERVAGRRVQLGAGSAFKESARAQCAVNATSTSGGARPSAAPSPRSICSVRRVEPGPAVNRCGGAEG